MASPVTANLAYLYSRARSFHFGSQFFLLDLSSRIFSRAPFDQMLDKETFLEVRKQLLDFLWRDSQNIEKGYYPLSVLKPESPIRYLARSPKVFLDGISIYRRRKAGQTKAFKKKAQDKLSKFPDYYQRNFHFQTNGYLSKKSADLYEHQVEMLFSGTADGMRRLIIPPFKKFYPGDGEGLTFLEVAAGTGRASRFMKLAYPKAKIVVTDISEPYIKVAQEKLSDLEGLDYLQADCCDLPFKDSQFDGVYSVFQFHELPLKIRKKAIQEAQRACKDDGIFGVVDSIQRDDTAFNSLIEQFPRDYHEPFFKNYIETPLAGLMEDGGLMKVREQVGLFSKVCYGQVAKA